MKPYGIDDAETDLRLAIEADNHAEIVRLGALIDSLEAQPAPVSLHSAALYYAEQGLPVFPLSGGTKQPLAKCETCKATKCPGPFYCEHPNCHGLKDATTDLLQVAAWWTKYENANIGIATGHLMDVVDVDGLLGQQSRSAGWDTNFGQIDADAIAKVLTPRPGGMHIYVPVTGDGNSTGIVPGIDYRGIGGYVVAPPSIIAPGGKDHPGTYRFFGPVRLAGLISKAA